MRRHFYTFYQSFAFYSGIIFSRLFFGFIIVTILYLIISRYMGIR